MGNYFDQRDSFYNGQPQQPQQRQWRPPQQQQPQQQAWGGYDPRYWNNIQGGAGDLQDFNRFAAQFIGGYSPQGGPFQVGGDPNARAWMQNQVNQNARGYQGQALTAANMAGVDPAMRQWMQLQALMQGQGAGANAMNAYAGQTNMANDQMRRAFLDAIMSSNLGLQRQNNQYQWQSGMQQDQLNNSGGWGDIIGGIAGTAAGGWLSPGGLFRGRG